MFGRDSKQKGRKEDELRRQPAGASTLEEEHLDWRMSSEISISVKTLLCRHQQQKIIQINVCKESYYFMEEIDR